MTHGRLKLALPIFLLAAMVFTGCRHTPKYTYSPDVREVSTTGSGAGVDVRTFVTLEEIQADEKTNSNGTIRFRVRVENRGSTAVKLLRDRMDLISDDLRAFGQPELDPAEKSQYTIKPAGSLLVDVSFPVPGEHEDASGGFSRLTLMWTFRAGEKTYSNSATFRRERVYDRYYYPDRYHDHYGYHYHGYPYYRYHHGSHGFGFHLRRSYHW